MDPFNNINPFDRNFAPHAGAPQPQQQQMEFDPYVDQLPHPDTAVAEHPAAPGPYQPHLSEEGRRLAEALGLDHQTADGFYPERAVTGRENANALLGAPSQALTWPHELAAEGHDRNPLQAILASSLLPPAPHHGAPDGGVRYFNWIDGHQQATNAPSGIASFPGYDVLTGDDLSLSLRPAMRQRTLDQPEGNAIDRQPSDKGNSAAREPMEDIGTPFRASDRLVLPPEGYDQDLLWAMMESAGPSSSGAPAERHDPPGDLGVPVSSILPSQDTPSAPFIVHNDRFTALFVPAAAVRGGSPLNLSSAPIYFGSRLENASQPGADPAGQPSPALLAQTMEQAAPLSARTETTVPAARDVYAASFAVPEGFSHGTQPAPITMIERLGQWGLLPDAAQPMKQYDILGELYTGLLGPGGPNDVRLIHHPQM
ncbi:hypothetical protein [Bradyrhizobium centrosematis]|uniref:hypothetical protein n=1 Tax=Bradyrhizobium centrosematis TaxID=1300039 RepID=UPI00388E9A52